MNGLRLTASTDDARVARVIFLLIIAMPMRPGKKKGGVRQQNWRRSGKEQFNAKTAEDCATVAEQAYEYFAASAYAFLL